MDLPPSGDRSYLYKLEQLHKMIVCYLWLSYRFPNVFTTRSLANYTKKLVEDQIEKTLNDFSFIEQARLRMKASRGQARKAMVTEPEDVDEVDEVDGPAVATLKQQIAANGYPDNLPASKLDSLAAEHEKRNSKLSEEVDELLQGRTPDEASRHDVIQTSH
jgi:ATP-dependent RNA helicase SUPV3L1/SUV3